MLRLRLPLSTGFGNADRSTRGSRAPKLVRSARRAPDNAELVVIKTHVPPGFGVNASQPNVSRGRWIRWRSKFGNQPQNVADIAAVTHDL